MNDDTPSRHPDGSRLDPLAVGFGDEQARAHVGSCVACAKYVEILARGSEAFAKDEMALQRFVRGAHIKERGRRKRFVGAWVGGGASLLAAGLALFVHHREDPLGEPIVATASEERRPSSTGDAIPRFKGGTQVAVIVDHLGVQDRRTGPVELEVKDRVRLELALDHDDRLAAGVLAENGEWGDLQAPALLASGTHYSEQSIRFDEDVPRGWILVGRVNAIAKARRDRDFHEVLAIAIRPKRP